MTSTEQARLSVILSSSQRGAATLMDLAEAHDLAARYRMTDTLAYLRDQIRNVIQGSADGHRRALRSTSLRSLGIGVGIGVAAGLCTHFILVAAGQRHVVGRRLPLPQQLQPKES